MCKVLLSTQGSFLGCPSVFKFTSIFHAGQLHLLTTALHAQKEDKKISLCMRVLKWRVEEHLSNEFQLDAQIAKQIEVSAGLHHTILTKDYACNLIHRCSKTRFCSESWLSETVLLGIK